LWPPRHMARGSHRRLAERSWTGRRATSRQRPSGRSSLRRMNHRSSSLTSSVSKGSARRLITMTQRWFFAVPRGSNYQPPPPPPPPPPPEEPPPLEPGAVEAEPTALESDEPTVSTKLVGLLHGLLDPEYQAKPCCPCAEAAARTPSKRLAQWFSTASAIANGRYFSNSSGVSLGGVIRSSRSASVIDRYCLKPAIWSSTLRPSAVGAAIHQKAEITSGAASRGNRRGSHQPLFSAASSTGMPMEEAITKAANPTSVSKHLPPGDS